MGGAPKKPGGAWWQVVEDQLLAPLALGCFVGSILASTVLQILAIGLLILHPSSPLGWTLLALLAALCFVRLGDPPAWAVSAITFACRAGASYFPTRVIMEDEKAFSADKPYLVALEPHSALPTAVPGAFGLHSVLLPDALKGRTHTLVSSVCFKVPFVRHLYYWWGFRPITKRSMKRLLASNKSVVLVPGGVQECLVMEHGGVEVVFLRKRKGFIRMAMQTGVEVVPVFAFGQSQTYKWLRPGPPFVSDSTFKAISRKIGMVPLVLLGRWGGPIPHRVPMTVVVGRPMAMPHSEHPDEEVVQEYLDKFIAELEGMFERHKVEAGHKDLQLRVL